MAYRAKMFIDGKFAVQHDYDSQSLANDWVELMRYSYEKENVDMKRFCFTIELV